MVKQVGETMATHSVQHLIEEARRGSRETLSVAIESVRSYLLLVAERELGRDLRAKTDPSDIVQETLLKAHRDFENLEGCTETQFRAWLRGIMRHCILEVRRQFESFAQEHRKRGTARGRRAGK